MRNLIFNTSIILALLSACTAEEKQHISDYKQEQDQDWKWVNIMGFDMLTSVSDVSIDDRGLLYTVGSFDRSMRSGTRSLRSRGEASAFVHISSINGEIKNLIGYGDSGFVTFSSVSVIDSSLFVASNVSPTPTDIGRWGRIVARHSTGVIAMLDLSGRLIWAHPLPGDGITRARAVAGTSGQVYVAGSKVGTSSPSLTEDGVVLIPKEFELLEREGESSVIASYSRTGNEQWIIDLEAPQARVTVSDLSVLPNGSFCAAGGVVATQPTTLLTSGAKVHITQGRTGFVALFSPSGRLRWLKVLGADSTLGAQVSRLRRPQRGVEFAAVAADSRGGCVAVGSGWGIQFSDAEGESSSNDAPVIARYGADGDRDYVISGVAQSPHAFAESVSVFGTAVVVGGSYIDGLVLGPLSAIHSSAKGFSPRNGFVVTIDSTGIPKRLVSVRGETSSTVEALASTEKAVYAAGDLWGWAWFSGRRVGSTKGSNSYVARLNLEGSD